MWADEAAKGIVEREIRPDKEDGTYDEQWSLKDLQ